MGAQTSSNKVEAIKEHVVDTVTKTLSQCQANTQQSADQLIEISGIFAGNVSASAEQTAQISMNCLQDQNILTQLQSDVANTISQEAKAAGVGLIPALGNSTAQQDNKIHEIVRSSVTSENIANMNMSSKQQLTQEIKSSSLFVLNASVKSIQNTEIIARSVINILDKTGLFAKVEDAMNQQAVSETANPLDFIAKTVGAIGTSLSQIYSSILGGPAIMVFMFVIIAVVFLIVKGGGIIGATKVAEAGVKARSGNVSGLTSSSNAASNVAHTAAPITHTITETK